MAHDTTRIGGIGDLSHSLISRQLHHEDAGSILRRRFGDDVVEDQTQARVDHFTQTFDAGAARFKEVGNFWHLRDARGKLVVVHSGQDIFDTNTGELLKITPNVNPDFAAVICPALGGSPAI